MGIPALRSGFPEKGLDFLFKFESMNETMVYVVSYKLLFKYLHSVAVVSYGTKNGLIRH